MQSWRFGLLVLLAGLGHAVAVHAQGVAGTNSDPSATAPGANATGGPGGGSPANVQRGGTANVIGRPPATAPRLSSRSYNRLTTARQDVVPTASRPVGTSVAAAGMPRPGGDSLHPYSDQMLRAQAAGSNSEVPWSSTQQPRPETPPVIQRPTASHNFYPSMRTGRYPNANTAQITSGRTGVRHICVPGRGAAMAGGVRGR
ncbi:MAG: hypothetical protein ACLQGP_32595 [Isosphaeraceae bacterium]